MTYIHHVHLFACIVNIFLQHIFVKSNGLNEVWCSTLSFPERKNESEIFQKCYWKLEELEDINFAQRLQFCNFVTWKGVKKKTFWKDFVCLCRLIFDCWRLSSPRRTLGELKLEQMKFIFKLKGTVRFAICQSSNGQTWGDFNC